MNTLLPAPGYEEVLVLGQSGQLQRQRMYKGSQLIAA
jgi:hypothetical protein